MRKLPFLPLAFFLFIPPLTAQEAKILTWEQCIAVAQQNNPDLQSALKARESARAVRNGSYNGLMPNLNLSSRYSDSDAHVKSGRWGASADAGIDLLNVRNNAAIKSASAALDQAAANYRVQSAQVRFNLRQAFTDLLLAQEQVLVSEKIRDLRKNDAQMVSLKYDSGRESKGNMLRSNAERTEAEANFSDSIRQLRVAQMNLNRQLGQDEFSEITATGTLASPQAVKDVPNAAALTTLNPQVAAQQAEKDISAARLTNSRSALWPTLSGNYSRSFQGETYFPDTPHWSVSGVLTYPLFSGGPTYTYYAVAAAKRDFEKAAADLRSVQNQVRAQIESAWANFAKSVDTVQVQMLYLESARQRNDEATIRYSSGLMTYENWEIVVTDLVNFERSSIRSKRDAMVSEASWEQSIGKTLEE